jgi:hypothetical protein
MAGERWPASEDRHYLLKTLESRNWWYTAKYSSPVVVSVSLQAFEESSRPDREYYPYS